ncbi:hypothetical protein [Amycolatopsis palatopharyngis]|uniref:hypothetical protein n=1 Tax=Amycolatopsis palatopharyngis TaxID=187982 RepID=UPI000E24EBF2|nr:hypothetical protein [Amycolatopsis palatopharyngis]
MTDPNPNPYHQPNPNPFHPPAVAETSQAAKTRKWPWILAVAAAFVVGTGAGAATSSSPRTASPSSEAAPSPVTETVTAPPETVTVAPPEPVQTGPLTEFSDGVYEVGTDIEAGKYKTQGASDGIPCYWARLNADSQDIIDNSLSAGPMVLTAHDGEVQGCDWTKS